jgi:hypothetical protein
MPRPAPSPLGRLRAVALALALPLGAVEAGASRRVGIRVEPPAGFTWAPTAVARRSAQSLPDLLEAAGLEPLGVTRARQALAGSPADPTATLLLAQVRVLTAAPGTKPVLDAPRLAAALAAAQPEGDAAPLGPLARSAAGMDGHELGWTVPLDAGRARLVRRLLLPQPGGVLVLALDVRAGDEKQWSATWARLVRTLAPEVPPRESSLPLVPMLPLALAAAALAAAACRRSKREPELPSEAFVAGLERRGRSAGLR